MGSQKWTSRASWMVIKRAVNPGNSKVFALSDFIEVPIKDAENCLECMTDDRILLDSVEIEVKICTTTCKLAIEVGKMPKKNEKKRTFGAFLTKNREILVKIGENSLFL